MAIGIALRLLRYLADRSLWLDEAYLANNILTFSWKDLLTKPLMHWQAAPVGFLLLQKLAVVCLGSSEYALRVVPLMAGIVSIPLFYAIIRRSLGPAAQVMAMLLFVTLDPLVYYSAEAKQYGIDVSIALALIWAAMRWMEQKQSWARLILLALLGGVGIFLSHPAVFVLASIGTVFLFRAGRAGILLRLLCVGAGWIALFAINYLVFLRPLMHHAGLAAYWAADYMPYQWLAAIKWLGWEFYELYFGYSTMWLPLVETAMIAMLIGIGWFYRANRSMLEILLLPLVLTLAAAIVHVYPFGSRLVLFLVPMLVVFIGAGCAVIWESVTPSGRWVAALILATIFIPTAARDLYYIVFTQKREEIRPVMAYIRDHKQPGDSLYIFYISDVPFRYYENRFGLEQNRFGLDNMNTIVEDPGEADAARYRADLARLKGRGRVWILITHPAALGGIDETQVFPAILDQWGRRLDRFDAFNATAMLYDI